MVKEEKTLVVYNTLLYRLIHRLRRGQLEARVGVGWVRKIADVCVLHPTCKSIVHGSRCALLLVEGVMKKRIKVSSTALPRVLEHVVVLNVAVSLACLSVRLFAAHVSNFLQFFRVNREATFKR